MTVEYKNEVADMWLEDWEVLDAVSRDSTFWDLVKSKLKERDERKKWKELVKSKLKERNELKKWEEVERRKCTIQKIYEYPIHNSDWTTTIGHWFILKPDVLKDNESKEFTISHAVDEMNISWFKKWQNVLYITSKMERPATDKEKKYYKRSGITVWKREIKPIKSKEK